MVCAHFFRIVASNVEDYQRARLRKIGAQLRKAAPRFAHLAAASHLR
jgi:hypothetical protein